MKATTRNMAEAITQALGPVFHANPDYKTISEAMALTIARVAQSTPDKGNEEEELEIIMQIAANALNVFLNEEEAIQEAKAKVIQRGIESFSEMVPSDGDNIIKAMRDEETAFNNLTSFPEGIEMPTKLYGNPESRLDPHGMFVEPVNGLAAINGGVSPEACAEAEKFAGQDHDQWGDGGPMAAKHLDPKDDELEGPEYNEGSWSPDPERVGWANNPIHQEIARFEQEHPNRDDGYNPDGPRAYL